GAGEPLLQVGNRRRIVVIEVRAGGEQLDHLEAVRRDRLEMIARQPLVMEKVRRNPERSCAHRPNSLSYSSSSRYAAVRPCASCPRTAGRAGLAAEPRAGGRGFAVSS